MFVYENYTYMCSRKDVFIFLITEFDPAKDKGLCFSSCLALFWTILRSIRRNFGDVKEAQRRYIKRQVCQK